MTAGDAPTRRRLFVALPVATSVRRGLAAALAGRRAGTDWRWTAPETWHVTLAFLGDVWEDPADVAALVAEGVEAVGTRVVGLRLGGPIALGDRVVAYAVDDDPAGAVARLGEQVQGALDAANVPVQRRAVVPHLTVARARGRAAGACDLAAVPPVDAAWEVDRAVVFASTLGAEGARYDALAEVPFS
ncbi:MAG: RNA 2',3'-cyclic phosphodiesterase [Actinomycetes bacterium]